MSRIDYIKGTDTADEFIFNWDQGATLLKLFDGDDSIIDNSFADDRLYGGFGNDWMETSAGNDLLAGMQGNDTLVVHAGDYNVTARGGRGHDVLNIYGSTSHEMHTSDGGITRIELDNGEHISARSIEEINFL